MKAIRFVFLSILLTLTISTGATADGKKDPLKKAIEARIGLMKNYSWNAGPLFQMAKGKMEYDAEKAAAYAKNLELISMMNNGSHWPAGSDNEAYPDDTRTLKALWETFPKVGERGQAFKTASAELAAVAGDGLDALRSKIGALGKSCKGCHDDYRAEK